MSDTEPTPERRRERAPRESPGNADPIRSAFVMAVRVMEAGRASLLIRRNGEPVLTIAAAVGIAPSIIPNIRVQIGNGIAGVVAERGASLLGVIGDATFLSVPVVSHQGILGVLNMTERMGHRPYTSRDLASSMAMTQHIAEILEYRRESLVDVVTGLPNRKAFQEVLDRELERSRRSISQFSVVFLDVDGLKAVNDRYGHSAGDALIRTVGAALQGLIRPYDFAARWGADEFVLLLADTEDGDESVTARVAALSSVSQAEVGDFSVSLGIARYPADGESADELLAVADERMYQFKRAHRPDARQ